MVYIRTKFQTLFSNKLINYNYRTHKKKSAYFRCINDASFHDFISIDANFAHTMRVSDTAIMNCRKLNVRIFDVLKCKNVRIKFHENPSTDSFPAVQYATLALKMIIAIFAETQDNFQHSTWLIPKNPSCMFSATISYSVGRCGRTDGRMHTIRPIRVH
jgi:hypothetical protein